jgi:hypothetical protein
MVRRIYLRRRICMYILYEHRAFTYVYYLCAVAASQKSAHLSLVVLQIGEILREDTHTLTANIVFFMRPMRVCVCERQPPGPVLVRAILR